MLSTRVFGLACTVAVFVCVSAGVYGESASARSRWSARSRA